MQSYRPDPRILELGDEFYDEVEAANFPRCVERFRNLRWARRVGLDLADGQWADHFCRFEPLPNNLSSPLALRYHGHQFRVYNPDIGDGRGFLFAQLRDDRGRLLDLGTKGSGRTPHSRGGDGRLTLKGGVREILATEMLEALGVDTSKSFALFETGEELVRGDEPSPTRSAVLTRLSHGHIRIGSFQRLAFFRDVEGIGRLASYCLATFYGETNDDPAETAFALFDRVSAATARLAASYIAAGFVHGVLNSDNIAISGESFDYGPWRFAPEFDPDFTAAYFDHYGLYSFGRQPEAIQWDLAQLGGALSLVAPTQPLSATLSAWGGRFEAELGIALIDRLGIERDDGDGDRMLVAAILSALRSRLVGIDRFFFDWRGGRDPGHALYPQPLFRELAKQIEGRPGRRGHPYWSGDQPCSMLIDEVEAIWSRIDSDDDWSAFEAKIEAIRTMGEAMAEDRKERKG